MKKLYFSNLLILLVISNLTLAQTYDWAIKSIKEPSEIVSSATNTPINLVVECENRGTTPLKSGDSITFNLLIFDLQTNNLLVQYPNNAISGNSVVLLLTNDVAVNGTYDISLSLNLSGKITQSRNIRMGVTSVLINRSNPIVDDDSTDNQTHRDMVWWNEYRDGVSVEQVSYNPDNIKIWPNPAHQIMHVTLHDLMDKNATIELYDITGKSVLESQYIQSMSPNQWLLNTATLKNGIYILQVNNGNKVITSKVTISH